MMGRALLVVGWLGTAGLVASAVVGFTIQPGESGSALSTHLLLGLLSSLLILFAHSWIMFYLIGTGKAIKEAVAEHGLTPDHIERTKEFKNRCYPWLMLAMGVTMASFILGGGVYTGVIPPWVHHGLFYAALLAQLKALFVSGGVLRQNEQLMRGIDRGLMPQHGEEE